MNETRNKNQEHSKIKAPFNVQNINIKSSKLMRAAKEQINCKYARLFCYAMPLQALPFSNTVYILYIAHMRRPYHIIHHTPNR